MLYIFLSLKKKLKGPPFFFVCSVSQYLYAKIRNKFITWRNAHVNMSINDIKIIK